eukprot:1517946-Ditylum_brightwellii.AAC.1
MINGGGKGFNIDLTKKVVQKHADEHNKNNEKPLSPEGGIRAKIANKTTMHVASATASYLFTIASTHFVEGRVPSNHPAKNRFGTEGSEKLVKLIK